MLPNLGNGSFTFSFYASDPDGHTVLLGTRAVTCDNAHATRPFGAIDTPAPGEVVNGTTYDNFGWVLAPAPGLAAPPDGGTVTVFIDGVPHGSPRAWGPRDDLSKLFAVKTFPGIARAQGVFTLDLSGLSNGVHTIAWTVTDHLGASAGIGSRYFTVVNGAAVGSTTSSQKSETRGTSVRASWSEPAAPIVSVAVNRAALDTGVIRVRRGYIEDTPFRNVRPGPGDRTIIQAEELDRIEMRFGGTDGDYTGYVRVGHDLVALPIGSQLDRSAGTFTWQPGAGFVGAYDLVFVRWNDSGPVARLEVRIVLNPHGSGRVGPQVVVDTPTGHMSPDESIPQPLVVAGWAVDLDASLGTGIDAVHVWAYPLTGGNPVFVGDATYGGRRPDVGAVHGDHFRDSGYCLTVRDLAPGVYDLAVFARSAGTGRFAPAKIVRVSVQ
jgi:hypothetical protein